MKRYRVVAAAIAAACMMGTGAASASAAITVGPGPGPFASTITLPASAGGFRFSYGGGWFSCGAQVVSSITTTGAATVSAFNEDACPGTFTFHPPFSGQIVGSPGHYALQIPVSFTYKETSGLWTCEHSGTVRLPLTSGSNFVGPATSTSLTAPASATCPLGVSTILVSGLGGGTNSITKTITGTL